LILISLLISFDICFVDISGSCRARVDCCRDNIKDASKMQRGEQAMRPRVRDAAHTPPRCVCRYHHHDDVDIAPSLARAIACLCV